MPTPYAGNPASYPTAINILSGSDVPNATNFNTAYEGLADRCAFLNAQLGAVNIHHINNLTFVDTSGWNRTWFTASVGVPQESTWLNCNAGSGNPAAAWASLWGDVQAGDFYEATFSGTVLLPMGGGNLYGLALGIQETGSSGVVYTRIGGSAQMPQAQGSTVSNQVNFTLTMPITAAGSTVTGFTGVAGFTLYIFSSNAETFTFNGDYNLTAKLYRSIA